MSVERLMTREVKTCRRDDSLAAAAQIMWDADCGCVPVVEGDRVVGMITDRDICMAANFHGGETLSALRVADAMARRIYSCAADANLSDATEIMAEARVRRLPVVDENGGLVGLLSLNDVVMAVNDGRANREITERGLARVIASVCAPRRRDPARAEGTS